MQTETEIARAVTALSHPRRVRLFRILKSAGNDGVGFESLRRSAKMNNTTLRHHLRPTQAVGLVVRRREGTKVAFRLHGQAVRRAIDEMSDGLAEVCPAHRSLAQKPPLNLRLVKGLSASPTTGEISGSSEPVRRRPRYHHRHVQHGHKKSRAQPCELPEQDLRKVVV